MILEQLDTYVGKNPHLLPHSMHKMWCEYNIDLHIYTRTIKFLKESIRQDFHNLRLGKDFTERTNKMTSHKKEYLVLLKYVILLKNPFITLHITVSPLPSPV